MPQRPLSLVIAALGFAVRAVALQIDYANKGTDGDFNPTGATYEVDLAKATSGQWDAATPGNDFGVYDAGKWAVVFKFSSINIPAGTTVTFKNHPSRAPVVWLVSGAVEIAGTVDLNGKAGDTDPDRIRFSEPGPGGFRGGDGPINASSGPSGLGPGGGAGYRRYSPTGLNRYPSYGTAGYATGGPAAPTYGNPSIIPLIGGSGNSTDVGYPQYGGGAGGGALLLVTSGTLNFSGLIQANGGAGGGERAYGGSGGAVRIICDTAAGNGVLQALGAGSAGHGRLRLEVSNYAAEFATQPPIFPVVPNNPVQLWSLATTPTARIISVNALNAPTDPRASMSALIAPDIRLAAGSLTNVVTIETINLPKESVVTLRIVSTPGESDQSVNADYLSTDAGNPNRHLWRKQVVIEPGYHALQVLARAP